MMMFLAFNMHHEMGDFLNNQALEAMEKAKASWGSLLWRAALNEAMGHHLDAADNYVKERSFNTASQCLAWASLVGVQLQLGPEVRLVGLTQAEARKTMGLRPFREGITLARAYDLHRLNEWLPAVYQHVMVSGQAAYVEELWQHLPYDASLYADIVHRFKADPQRQVHTANCKKFLLSLSDKFIAFDLARELGFDDVLHQLSTQHPEIVEWKTTQPGASASSSSSSSSSSSP